MAVFLRTDSFSTAVSTDWHDDNQRGLSHAATGQWLRASESFHHAVQELSRVTGEIADGGDEQEALGLTIANLSQAMFRAGRLKEALDLVQQAIEVRAMVGGMESMPVLRSRMDRAVMLASAGHVVAAQRELGDVIAKIELQGGVRDARLAVPLENAARVALAQGDQDAARAFATRLHGVLAEHGLATARASQLLDRLAPAPLPELVFVDPVATATLEAPGMIEEDEEEDEAPSSPMMGAAMVTPVYSARIEDHPVFHAPIAFMADADEETEEEVADDEAAQDEEAGEPLMGSSEIIRAIIAETGADPDEDVETRERLEQARQRQRKRTTRSMQRIEAPAEQSRMGNLFFAVALLGLFGTAIGLWISLR
jgi:hypothetical protein